MNDTVNTIRRKILLGMMTLPASGIAGAAMKTPSASEGPFYPTTDMRYNDIDNDLVKISDQIKQAGGEIVKLTGRILDKQGNPLQSARVEIWQCDVKGRYLHRADFDPSSSDSAFQGFGQAITDAEGNYAFRTIKPVPYSGRTPHIHLKVWLDGKERLTTQLYLPDHPQNARDWLYQRIPKDKRQLVTMFFEKTDQEPEARVDLVV